MRQHAAMIPGMADCLRWTRFKETLEMTDRMLFSLSIFLTGLGAGIALAAFVAPHSRILAGRLVTSKSDENILDGKTAALPH
ncbi:MAG: hypothetical protein ABSH50_14970 [Bryobacteraceae bacterium]